MLPILGPQCVDSMRRQKASGLRGMSVGMLGLLFILFGCSSCVSEPRSYGSVRDNLGRALYSLYKPRLVRIKSSVPGSGKEYICYYGSGSDHFQLELYKGSRADEINFEVHFKPEGPYIRGRDDELSRLGWWSKKGIHGLYISRRYPPKVTTKGVRLPKRPAAYNVGIRIDGRKWFFCTVYPDEDKKITVFEYDADRNSREITFGEFKRKYTELTKGRDQDLLPSAANLELLLEDLARGKSDKLWEYVYGLVKKKIPKLPPLE